MAWHIPIGVVSKNATADLSTALRDALNMLNPALRVVKLSHMSLSLAQELFRPAPDSKTEGEGEDGDGDTKGSIGAHVVGRGEAVNALRRPETEEQVVHDWSDDSVIRHTTITHSTAHLEILGIRRA